MKKTSILCAAAVLICTGYIPGQENKPADQSLADLLKNLESDKAVKEAYRQDTPEDTSNKVPPRRPAEVLNEVSERMDAVVRDLDAEQPEKKRVANNQKKIVDLLDDLLKRAAAAASRSSSSGSSGGTPSGSMLISLPEGGGGEGQSGGGSGSADTSGDSGTRAGSTDSRQWGDLPDNVREEILQLFQEDIPVMYRELLRLYFKNLEKE